MKRCTHAKTEDRRNVHTGVIRRVCCNLKCQAVTARFSSDPNSADPWTGYRDRPLPLEPEDKR